MSKVQLLKFTWLSTQPKSDKEPKTFTPVSVDSKLATLLVQRDASKTRPVYIPVDKASFYGISIQAGKEQVKEANAQAVADAAEIAKLKAELAAAKEEKTEAKKTAQKVEKIMSKEDKEAAEKEVAPVKNKN